MFEWFIGIATGLISGAISGVMAGMLVGLYFRHKDQVRLIFQYANETADHAYEITVEAKECLSGKDPSRLKELLQKPLHRNFVIKITDKELQEAIANCNQGVYAIKCALDQDNRHQLLRACGNISDKLLDLWSAITKYEEVERVRGQKQTRCFYVILILICTSLVAFSIIA